MENLPKEDPAGSLLLQFSTADPSLLENARARFPQPLGKLVQGNTTPGRWSAKTGFPQIHNLDDGDFIYLT